MSGRARAWIWPLGLALALALLAGDSARRLRGVEAATDTPMGMRLEPEVDLASPSGYRWDQHRLLLTQIDGYQWLLQAERALASGDARVRTTDYDNAPDGREVHWAGPMRWWIEGLAELDHAVHPEVTATRALERVAPWANAALLALLLIVLTPVVAAGLGSLPAALFALGSVLVFPYYDFFGVGYLDHHGLAATTCLMSVLLLVAGGAGWIRAEDEPAAGSSERAVWDALPTRRGARRWLLAAGLTAAAGLWVSAASIVPVLLGTGLGALVAAVAARTTPPRAPWHFDPALFRLWGAAGAAGSLFFYLIEYFPNDLGMRLEVNHPLYALAFLGAGELLARLGRALSGLAEPTRAWARRQAGWLAGGAALTLALPAVILLTGESTFRLTDRFLWTLHDRYIIEFLDLRAWTLTRLPSALLGEQSLIPLVALPVAALLWPTGLTGAWRSAWRALLILLVGAAGVYAYIYILGVTVGAEAPAVVGAVAAVALWFGLPLAARTLVLPPPLQGTLALAVAPAGVLLVTSLVQMRWLGIAAALWLGAAVVTAAALIRSAHPLVRAAAGRAALGGLAAVVLVLPPLFAMRGPFEPSKVDTVTRDVALWLRRRLGDAPGVVLSAPGPTTQLIWFGGLRGVGTLYWENLDGLRASRGMFGATDPDSALALLRSHGVTHVVFFGWEGGVEQLRLSAAAVGLSPGGGAGVLDRVDEEARVNDFRSLPSWLVPLPYVPPTVAGYPHPVVKVFEVAPEQRPEVALVRLARFHQLFGDQRMEPTLLRALELGPSVPGLALLAQLQHVRGERDAFAATFGRLRTELERAQSVELGDRLEAAIALGLAGDVSGVVRQLDLALAGADERQLRRLGPDRLQLLVELARRGALERTHPEALALAERLLRAR